MTVEMTALKKASSYLSSTVFPVQSPLAYIINPKEPFCCDDCHYQV